MPDRTAGNQGVVARSVTADVLAVGAHARATKTISLADGSALEAQIEALRRALDALTLTAQQRSMLDADLAKICEAAAKPDSHGTDAQTHLQSFCDKLKMVGVAVGEVAGLVAPIKQIAGLLQIPLHLVGLI